MINCPILTTEPAPEGSESLESVPHQNQGGLLA